MVLPKESGREKALQVPEEAVARAKGNLGLLLLPIFLAFGLLGHALLPVDLFGFFDRRGEQDDLIVRHQRLGLCLGATQLFAVDEGAVGAHVLNLDVLVVRDDNLEMPPRDLPEATGSVGVALEISS